MYIVDNALIIMKKFVRCFVFVLTPLVAIVTCHRLYKLPDPILLLPFKVCPQGSLRSTKATQTWRLAGRFWFSRSPTWFQVRGRICWWQIWLVLRFWLMMLNLKNKQTNKKTPQLKCLRNALRRPSTRTPPWWRSSAAERASMRERRFITTVREISLHLKDSELCSVQTEHGLNWLSSAKVSNNFFFSFPIKSWIWSGWIKTIENGKLCAALSRPDCGSADHGGETFGKKHKHSKFF